MMPKLHEPLPDKDVRKMFENLLTRLGYGPFYNNVTSGILYDSFQEPHKSFHNASHVIYLLNLIDEHQDIIRSWSKNWASTPYNYEAILQEAAIWHDYYHPNEATERGWLEALSIIHYCRFSPSPDQAKEMVSRIINATAFHDIYQEGLDPCIQLFLDFDLSTFALPWEEMDKSCDRVLEETKDVFSEVDNIKQFDDFLTTMLGRKSIYYIKTEWEKPARDNLKRRLQESEIRLSRA